MRISELRQREDYDAVLEQTLAPGLSAWADLPQQLRTGAHPVVHAMRAGEGGQPWSLHRLYSAYLTPNADPDVRRFLRDGFRVTHSLVRAAPQWALGTLAGTSLGARAASAPAFHLLPGLPHAHTLAILPGNRRFRLFDFSAGVSRVMAKAGTGASALGAEVALRSGPGPWLPITARAPDLSWFEERIHPGVPLSRAPLWAPREALAAEALATLDRLTQQGARTVSTEQHIDDLLRRIGAPALGLRPRGLIPSVTVGPSHGDAQPGNVLVSRGAPPLWIDWEFAATRASGYDRAVFALRMRFADGLSHRVRAAMEGLVFSHAALPTHRTARRTTLALVLLEELATVVEARRSLGLSGPPPVVSELTRALQEVLAL